MSCARPASLLVLATALAVTGFSAESAETPADSTKPPLLVPATPPAPPATPPAPKSATPAARPRVISPAVAAQLAVAVPKFEGVVPTTPAEPGPDLRGTDKPRNTIVRLPSYLVQEDKMPVFKESELLTPKARLHRALKKYPGLRFGSFWIFRNDGIALAMLAEEERLERKREFEDLASLLRFTDLPAHTTVKRQVENAFMREADFGR